MPHPLLRAIAARTVAKRISIQELDDRIRAGGELIRLVESEAEVLDETEFKVIERAVEMLGGRLVVNWRRR